MYFSKSVFGLRHVLSSQIEEPQKKMVNLYRSTRRISADPADYRILRPTSQCTRIPENHPVLTTTAQGTVASRVLPRNKQPSREYELVKGHLHRYLIDGRGLLKVKNNLLSTFLLFAAIACPVDIYLQGSPPRDLWAYPGTLSRVFSNAEHRPGEVDSEAILLLAPRATPSDGTRDCRIPSRPRCLSQPLFRSRPLTGSYFFRTLFSDFSPWYLLVFLGNERPNQPLIPPGVHLGAARAQFFTVLGTSLVVRTL